MLVKVQNEEKLYLDDLDLDLKLPSNSTLL